MVSTRSTGLSGSRRAIGTFPSRRAAENALHELKDSGFNMDHVSVIAKDSDGKGDIAGAGVHDRADNKADDGAKVGAVSGGAVGGLTGLLVGIGALAIPGIGPIMLAGAAATALATTAAGGAIGAAAGGLLGGLVGLGVPEDRAKNYNDRVSAGEYLVIVDGAEAEIAKAQTVLSRRDIQDWGIYDIPSAEGRSTSVQESVQPVAAVAPVAASRTTAESGLPTTDESVKLYEERLVVDKDRAKTGEVAIGKHIETETARVSVPIEKERVVIERVTPGNETVVTPDSDAFTEGEAMRVEVYEETPDIRKEAFVREEVSIRKEVTQETVKAEETLRREEIDINTQGRPVVDGDSIADKKRI